MADLISTDPLLWCVECDRPVCSPEKIRGPRVPHAGHVLAFRIQGAPLPTEDGMRHRLQERAASRAYAWAEARASLEAFGVVDSDLELLALAQAGKVAHLDAVLAHLTPGLFHDCPSCLDEEPCPGAADDRVNRARARAALLALAVLVCPKAGSAP